jgi:hypothetical protein
MKTQHLPYCLLLVLISSTLQAQIIVGPKAGINFNSFRGNKAFDVTPDFNLGGFAKMPIMDFLSARAELLYFRQGGKIIDYPVLLPELRRTDATVTFHTLQIPVMAELGLPSLRDAAIQPKLLVGAFYSYNLYARETYLNIVRVPGYNQVEYRGSTDVTSQFRRGQFGVVMGLAGEVKIFSFPVALEFRYNYHTTPVSLPDNRAFPNLQNTLDTWGDILYVGTVSFNAAVTIFNF